MPRSRSCLRDRYTDETMLLAGRIFELVVLRTRREQIDGTLRHYCQDVNIDRPGKAWKDIDLRPQSSVLVQAFIESIRSCWRLSVERCCTLNVHSLTLVELRRGYLASLCLPLIRKRISGYNLFQVTPTG